MKSQTLWERGQPGVTEWTDQWVTPRPIPRKCGIRRRSDSIPQQSTGVRPLKFMMKYQCIVVSVAKVKSCQTMPCLWRPWNVFWLAGWNLYIYIHIINVYYTNIYEGMYSCIITGVCYRYAMVGVERYDYFLRGTVPSNVLYSQSISSQKFWTKPRIIQESDLIVLGTSEPNKGSCWPWFLVSGRLQMLDFRSKAHFENFAGRFRKLQSQKIQIHMKETDYWKQ